MNSEISSKIIERLNSLSSAEQISKVVAMYAVHPVFSIRIAQRIISRKEEIGRFQDLQQIADVPGIGNKRLTSIINALGYPV